MRHSPRSFRRHGSVAFCLRTVRINLKSKAAVLLAVALLALSQSSQAASANWNVSGGGSWNTNSNWSPAASPGVSGTTTGNTDVAGFGLSGTLAHVVTDPLANRMLGGINITGINGTGNGADYTIGSGATTLYVNSGFSLSYGGVNTSTVADNWAITGNVNSGDFKILATAVGTLTISGNISSVATSGTSRATLSTNNAASTVLLSGNITDGGSGASVAVTRSAGVGIVKITGVNTYSGGFYSGGGSAIGTTQIGVDSVGSVGAITSSAFGTGVVNLNSGRISSDGTTARTIYNSLISTSGTNIFGDSVNNGTLTLAGAISSTAGLSAIWQADSTVNFTNTGPTTGSSQALILSGTANGSIAAALATNFTSITKTSSGTWTLSGANTYTGATTINDGALKVGANNTIKSTNNLTVNELTAGNTATLDLAGFNQQLNLLTLGGAAATTTGGNRVMNSSGTSVLTVNGVTYDATNNPLGGQISVTTLDLNGSARTFNIGDSTNAAADLTVSSVIQNGGIGKSGAGTLVLSGSNTYVGATMINTGILQIGNGGTTGSLSASSAITDNATLAFNRTDVVTQGADFSSVISGTGGVTQTGSGTLVLNGANTYSGTTKISSGILNATTLANINTTSAIGRGSAAGSAADLVLDGGTLQYTGTSAASTNRGYTLTTSGGGFDASGSANGTMAISGNMVASGSNGAQTLTLTGSGTGTLGGTVNNGTGSNVTSLTKTGAGLWTVTGANTYTGATTVENGTLAVGVSGSTSGTLVLGKSGATTGVLDVTAKTSFSEADIAGNGLIDIGTGKTVTATGNVTPGFGAGTLNVAGNFTLASTAATMLEIGGSGAGQFDLVNATAAITYGGTLTITSLGGYDLTQTATYGLFTAGSFSGDFNAGSSVMVNGLALTENGGVWSGTQSGITYTFANSSGLLSVAAVPEPGTWAMLLGGIGMLLGWQCRRRNA